MPGLDIRTWDPMLYSEGSPLVFCLDMRAMTPTTGRKRAFARCAAYRLSRESKQRCIRPLSCRVPGVVAGRQKVEKVSLYLCRRAGIWRHTRSRGGGASVSGLGLGLGLVHHAVFQVLRARRWQPVRSVAVFRAGTTSSRMFLLQAVVLPLVLSGSYWRSILGLQPDEAGGQLAERQAWRAAAVGSCSLN